MVRFEPSFLTAEQETKLQLAGDRLFTWSGASDLLDRVGGAVRVAGAQNVSVQLRHLPDQPDAPVICHVLNSNYDLESDAYLNLRDVELTIAGDLLDRVFSRATLYTPGESPLDVTCRTAGVDTVVSLPNLDMWAIIKLE